MTGFAVVILVSDRSFYRPKSYIVGDVQFFAAKADTPKEHEAINISQKYTDDEVNITIAPRAMVVCDAVNDNAALEIARVKIQEALDIIDVTSNVFGKYELLPIGFVRNMETGKVTEIKHNAKKVGPFHSYHMQPNQFSGIDHAQWLLSFANLDSPSLVSRLSRAAHWSRKAKNGSDKHLKVLFCWFAMEAAWKVDETDNIDLIIMLGLGFPGGRIAGQIDRSFLRTLQGVSDYQTWRTKAQRLVREIRMWRNDSVHSGFRPWDVDSSKMEKYEKIIELATPRVINLLKSSIVSGSKTIDEAKANLPATFEKCASVNDLNGTVIYNIKALYKS